LIFLIELKKKKKMFRWVRRWVRRSSKPIPLPVADQWKRRLSIAYGILAWNALAVVFYSCYQGKRDWATFHGLDTEGGSPAEQFSRRMDIKKAKVIRFGGSDHKEYEIDNTEVFDYERDETLAE